MLFSKIRERKKAKIEELESNAKLKAQDEFIEDLKSWHYEYSESQLKLDCAFDYEFLSEININVWDEISDVGSTYIYVEASKVPDKECFCILNHLYQFLVSVSELDATMRFYDISTKYPENLISDLGRNLLFKRWEILIEDVDSWGLDVLVNQLKAVPSYKGKKLNVYSES